MNFPHLATRSDMSVTGKAPISDYPGSARISELVAAAADQGTSALAITDLGSMRGAYELTAQCEKHGVKPIYGVEIYMCPNHKLKALSPEQREQICEGLPLEGFADAIALAARDGGYMQSARELTTLTLWALDDVGLKNLFALTSKGWIDGFYHKPRIDVALLREFSAGVACGTGGPNSWVNRPMLEGDRLGALNRAADLYGIFEDRLYLEIRPHRTLEQKRCNDFAAYDLSELYGGLSPLLATQLAHYVHEGDLPAQKMLTAIGAGKGSDHSSAGLPIDSYWLRTSDEMTAAFERCKVDPLVAQSSMLEAVNLADRCKAKLKIDPFAMIIPSIDTGELSHVEHLRDLCDRSGIWDKLLTALSDQFPQTEMGAYALSSCEEYEPACEEFQDRELKPYYDRLAFELDQLGRTVSSDSDVTFASYIVYVHEVVKMAKALGLTLGPGRGSAAGSLVNYLIGITGVDPIEHGLLFERFISPNRVGPPDIDIDCNYAMRPLLLEAMRERWGADCVALIATVPLLKGRRVLEDVCRELRVPLSETRKATKLIEQRAGHDKRPYLTIHDGFIGTGEAPASKELQAFNLEHPSVLAHCLKLEGKARSVGVHPGGIVVTPGPIWEYTPVETRTVSWSDKRVIVTAFDMTAADQVGLLKIDMLGVKTIDVIAIAMAQINAKYGVGSISWGIPLDDEATLQAFTAGDLAGVFQFDTRTARRLASGTEFNSFQVISDLIALGRPGPLAPSLDGGPSMADKYLARKGGALVGEDYCARVSEITKDTYGVIVYQEQVMKICGEVGLHENPDVMRKIMGKKLKDKIEAERAPFLAGAANSSPEMSREKANELYDSIAEFARYCFNASHSVAYGMVGYMCQYLKIHYPLEFFHALLSKASSEVISGYAKDAVSRGIKLAPPDVSKSGFELGIDYERGAIIGALTDIKGVGSKAAHSIVTAQPFSDLADLMDRVDRRLVSKGVVEKLARAGALDDLLPSVKHFVENLEHIFHESKLKRFQGWAVMLADLPRDDWSDSERLWQAGEVNPLALASPYTELLSSLSVDVLSFGAESFLADHDGQAVWVTGTIKDSRPYTGLYDAKGATAEELAHASATESYVVASLEDDAGTQGKIKFPWWVCKEFRESIVDDSQVLILAVADERYHTLRARVVIPLEALRRGESKTVWSMVTSGGNPFEQVEGLPAYNLKFSTADYTAISSKLHAGSWPAIKLVGIVTDIKTKLSGAKKKEMAWIGVYTLGGSRHIVTMFASDWLGGWDHHSNRTKEKVKGRIKPGSLVSIDVGSNEYRNEFSMVYKGRSDSLMVHAHGKVK